MKSVRGAVIGGLSSCVIGVAAHFSPAQAVLITPVEIVNFPLSNLPAGNFIGVVVTLDLSSSDPLGPNEGFRAQLFGGQNNVLRIEQVTTGPLSFDTLFSFTFTPFPFPSSTTPATSSLIKPLARSS